MSNNDEEDVIPLPALGSKPPIYPSQNPDFLSFNVTSDSYSLPPKNFNKAKSGENFNNMRGNPYNNSSGGYRNQFQQNNYNNQNRNSDNQFRQRRFRNYQDNDYNNFYNNNNNNFNRYGGEQGTSFGFGRYNNQNYRHNRGGGFRNNRNLDVSYFYHFSMLEDPWKELVERQDALSQSVLSNEYDDDLKGFYIEKEEVKKESSSDDDLDE